MASGIGGMEINQPIVGYDGNDAGLVTATVNPVTGGIKTLAVLTQAQYDALVTAGTVDSETEYNIVES